MQSRNRDTDMENKLRTLSVGGEGMDRIGILGLTYIHYHV